jgi:hypothetical protein
MYIEDIVNRIIDSVKFKDDDEKAVEGERLSNIVGKLAKHCYDSQA